MSTIIEVKSLQKVRAANVMSNVLHPAVDTPAVGQCIKNDKEGIVTGRCPITALPELSKISWEQRADICLGCNNKKLNGIENKIVPGRLDYGSTQSLKDAVKRDMRAKVTEPSEAEVRLLITALQTSV